MEKSKHPTTIGMTRLWTLNQSETNKPEISAKMEICWDLVNITYITAMLQSRGAWSLLQTNSNFRPPGAVHLQATDWREEETGCGYNCLPQSRDEEIV